MRAIETTKKQGSRLNLLQILAATDGDYDSSEDNSDGDDFEETGDYDDSDDCDS